MRPSVRTARGSIRNASIIFSEMIGATLSDGPLQRADASTKTRTPRGADAPCPSHAARGSYHWGVEMQAELCCHLVTRDLSRKMRTDFGISVRTYGRPYR